MIRDTNLYTELMEIVVHGSTTYVIPYQNLYLNHIVVEY